VLQLNIFRLALVSELLEKRRYRKLFPGEAWQNLEEPCTLSRCKSAPPPP